MYWPMLKPHQSLINYKNLANRQYSTCFKSWSDCINSTVYLDGHDRKPGGDTFLKTRNLNTKFNLIATREGGRGNIKKEKMAVRGHKNGLERGLSIVFRRSCRFLHKQVL